VVLFPLMFWFIFFQIISATQIPNFKWSQTNESLSLTFYYDPSKIVRLKNQAKIELKDQDFSPKTKNYEISEEWLIISWNDFKLELHLREDIVKDESWCKWKENYVFCSLRKKHAHIFDYLSTRDQVKMLKPYATKDWEATSVGEFVDEYEFDDSIPSIDVDSIKKLESKAKSAAIVRAFYPWCQHCHSEHMSFEQCKRDKKLKKKKFKFYHVDAREDRATGSYLNATCDTKCNFVVYYKNKMLTIPGKAKKKEFVEEIMYEIEDPYKVVKSQEKFEKMGKNDPVVGGYFEDTEGPAYTKFMEAAKGMKRRKDITYALLARDNPNWAKAFLGGANRAMLQWGKRKYTYTEFEGEKNFTTWVDVYASPLFEKYSYDLKKKWENVGINLPIVKIFLDEDEPNKKLKRKIEKIADKYREKLLFLYYPKNQDHMMTVTGLQKDDKPAFAISTSLKDDEAKHYAYRGSLSPKHVEAHCEAFLADQLGETYKTQVNPYDPAKNKSWEFGEAQQIVQTTWQSEIVESDLNIVLLMYKNWTTNKKEALQAMSSCALLFKGQTYMKFALYDYHENFWNYTAFTDKKHESDMQLYFYNESGERTSCEWANDKEANWSFKSLAEWVMDQIQDPARKVVMKGALEEFEAYQKEREAMESREPISEKPSVPNPDGEATGESEIKKEL